MAMRKRSIVLLSAAITVTLLLLGVAGVVVYVGTDHGRGVLRSRVESLIAGRVNGSVHVGAIRGSLWGDLRLDSLEIRDREDSLVVATGPISASYDVADLVDLKIILRSLRIERPFIHLRQDSAGEWTYKQLARKSPVPSAPRAGRGFGSTVLLDSVTVIGGHFRWTEPWRPNAAFEGAARDSVIAAELARTDHDTRQVGEAYFRARNWTGLGAVFPRIRVAHPDTAGVKFVIARLDVDESDPPLLIRDLRGDVLIVNDSVRIQVDEFHLPGSVGRAEGVVTTTDGLGVDVRIDGDSVSMADLNWVYPDLPLEGGGRMRLEIRKRNDSPYIAYALQDIDVRSMGSQLRGTMTFGVSSSLVDITDVDLDLTPLDFVLIERFTGEPLPLPWAGTLRGRVRARGGPLDRFVVDEADIAFADRNVPGVVNRFQGAGAIDITVPALTAFRDFGLRIDRLEMRTLQAVNPEFPPLRGWVAGTVRLDSVWTDVFFRDLDVRYADDTLPVSRMLGTGRVTTLVDDMVYDVTLRADSLSLDAVAASYPALPVRGMVAGAFTVRGRLSDLAVDGQWAGPSGEIIATLQMDALEPMYAVSGHVDLLRVDPAGWLRGAATVGGEVQAGIDLAITGDSLATLDGGVKVSLGRSRLGDLRVYGGRADLLFGQSRMAVDTVTLETSAFTLRGAGGIGLRAEVNDSVRLAVVVDSLGGLRTLATLAGVMDSVPTDSLAGRLTGSGVLRGNVEVLGADLQLGGTGLVLGTTETRRAGLDVALRDVLNAIEGTVTLRLDSAVVGAVRLDHAIGGMTVAGRDSARITLDLLSATGPSVHVAAITASDSARTSTRTRVDAIDVMVDASAWRLLSPRTVRIDADGVWIDTLTLRSSSGGTLRVAAELPMDGAIRGMFRADSVPLAELGRLAQSVEPLGGRVDVSVDLTGTRDAPVLRFDGLGRDAQFGESRVEQLSIAGRYADRVLRGSLDLRARRQQVARAEVELPLDLALRSVADRRVDAPLRGTIVADSTDLGVLEAFTTAIRGASGRVVARLEIGGTWDGPRVDGRLRLLDGAFGLPALGSARWRDVQGDIEFAGDTVHLRRLSAASGSRAGNEARVFGWVNIADPDDLSFDIRLRSSQFRAIANPEVATLDVSAELRLAGRESGSDLTGSVTIDGGDITIPDVYRKNVISLDDPEFYRIVDTTVFANRQLLPTAPTALVENLRVGNVTVNAGPDLWLRSTEANVKLGGGLKIAAGRSQRTADRGERQLALDGTLLAERGTYRLNLGVIQRTMEVEGGTVRFFGDPDNNAALDISALYTVRQYDQGDARQDVRVRAVLSGTILSPSLRLESPDSVRISGADLISYLVTGSPSFEVGGRASDYTSTAANLLFQSLGSALGSRLTGGAIDQFEVQTANIGQSPAGGRNIGSSILSGTRLRGSSQLTDDLFLRIDAGLCQVAQLVGGDAGGNFDPVALADAVGVKIDWRFSDLLGVSAGMEPSTSALLCASGANARGFAPTPRQWGIDLFRTWRF
jgi:translocation and assembly module TamB